ncbi:hypothetical protein [Chryseobacterium sp. Leaf201]|uniref:hypothetical protein n=1 Tax=Chryseobacterium sp. Leaf201 TaxID=1735672 RepID=UPI000FF876D8|nr:hypothetical protein [Chryseobacterium sp. Leaf201]
MQIIYLTILFIDVVKAIVLAGRKNLSSQGYVLIYLLVSFLLDLYGHYKLYLGERDFAYLFNYYSIFLIVFFFLYYSKILPKFKKIYWYSLVIMLVYISFFTKFYGQDYDNRLGILVCFYFITNTLVWFYERLKNFDDRKITDDPHFWVSCGLMLWSIFFIFRAILMFFLQEEDPDFLEILKSTQYVVNIIMYSLFYMALRKIETNKIQMKR